MQRLLPSTHLGSCKDIAYEVGVILQTDGASCPTPSITLKKALSITEGIHIRLRPCLFFGQGVIADWVTMIAVHAAMIAGPLPPAFLSLAG